MLNNDALFTLTQALQLVGLVPCVFVALLLVLIIPRNPQVIIPAAYFFSLACGFALPLLGTLFPESPHPWLTAALLAGESLLVALAFLLVVQFLQERVPALPYWLVLAIPLVGGSLLVYASLVQGECVRDPACDDIVAIRTLYNIFSAAFIFLLLTYYLSRFKGFSQEDGDRRHKYALVVALIIVHLSLLAVSLAQLAQWVTPEKAFSIATVLRLTFVYLVMTSLFRVFYPTLIKPEVIMVPVPTTPVYDPTKDVAHVNALQALLDSGVYREMRLNRAALAKKIGIGEHHLSRVINYHFGKSFNDLINDKRIDEAKQRLKSETTPITTIAFETGFNSIASFNRVFKAKVGKSPTEYRSGT